MLIILAAIAILWLTITTTTALLIGATVRLRDAQPTPAVERRAA